jgi:hypothetical protein
MDKERIRELAESAQERGYKAHREYLRYQELGRDVLAASSLNDAFYWFGHANAYKGVLMLMEKEGKEVGT